MKVANRLACIAALAMATCAVARGSEAPPKDGMLLSEIVKSVVAMKIGVITEAEFDHGLWEVEAQQGDRQTSLYLDPKTGKVSRREESADLHEILPPDGGKPLVEIIQSLEKQNVGAISEIEFDDGFWEVTVHKDGKKIKWDIDPMSGERQGK